MSDGPGASSAGDGTDATATDATATRREEPAGATALFLVGAATMVAELVWARELGHVLGSDLEGVAIAVGLFLLGGGAGSFVSARHAVAPRRWAVATTVSVLVVHAWIVWGLPGATLGWSGLASPLGRLLVAAPVCVPAFLLAGTVPAWFRGGRAEGAGVVRRSGLWIAALDLGSAVAAVATPLLLLPLLGPLGCGIAAAALAALAVSLPGADAPSEPRATNPAGSGPAAGLRRTIALLAGAITFALQVTWTRLLGEVLGAHLLVLGLAAASLLLGGALGSLAIPPLVRRHGAAAVVATATALWALAQGLTIGAIAATPNLYLAALEHLGTSGAVVLGTKITALLVTVLPPSVCGALLAPALAGGWSRDQRQLAHEAGDLQGLGLVGGTAGALLAGFVLVPRYGSWATLAVAAYATVAVALAIAVGPWRRELGRRCRTAVFALALGAAIVTPATALLDRQLLGAGVFQWHRDDIAGGGALAGYRQRTIVFDREGRLGRVIIERAPRAPFNASFLRVGGRVEGSAPIDGGRPSLASAPMGVLLGAIPRLVTGAGGEHLVIGIGGGTTVAAACAATGGAVTALEVEPAVIEALRSEAGRGAFPWETERLFVADGAPTLVVEDARAYLHRERRLWRSIICQPSEPWLPVSAPLFTPEFYRLVASRLEPGGVAVHWLQLYKIRPREFAAVLAGFRAAFPETWLVHPHPEESGLILVGTARPLDPAAWRRAWRSDGIAACRERFDWGTEPPLPLLTTAGVDRWLAGRAHRVPANLQSRLEFWLPILSDRGETHSGDILDSLRQTARSSPRGRPR